MDVASRLLYSVIMYRITSAIRTVPTICPRYEPPELKSFTQLQHPLVKSGDTNAVALHENLSHSKEMQGSDPTVDSTVGSWPW